MSRNCVTQHRYLLAGCRVTFLELLQFWRGNNKFCKTAVQTDHHILANINRRKVGPLHIRGTG
jgi:hypothetical protein